MIKLFIIFFLLTFAPNIVLALPTFVSVEFVALDIQGGPKKSL